MTYRTPSSHDLRWIVYLPEVGVPILDELEAVYAMERTVAERRSALIASLQGEWSASQRKQARIVARRCPATQPTLQEFQEIANAG